MTSHHPGPRLVKYMIFVHEGDLDIYYKWTSITMNTSLSNKMCTLLQVKNINEKELKTLFNQFINLTDLWYILIVLSLGMAALWAANYFAMIFCVYLLLVNLVFTLKLASFPISFCKFRFILFEDGLSLCLIILECAHILCRNRIKFKNIMQRKDIVSSCCASWITLILINKTCIRISVNNDYA